MELSNELEDLRKVYMNAVAARDALPIQKTMNRTFEKIRRHAKAIVDLIADETTRLNLTSMLTEDGLDYAEAQKFCKHMWLLGKATPHLLTGNTPPIPKARPGSINDTRRWFIIELYKYHWPHESRPKGSSFVEFCVEQLRIVESHVGEDVLRQAIMAIPISEFNKK
jgi:hypothetical protein